MDNLIAYVLGGDPSTGIGGDQSFARAHARAAIRAGFEPHFFCMSRRRGSEVTDVGTVHRIPSRLRLRKPRPVLSFRNQLAGYYRYLQAACLEEFVASTGRVPRVVHAFGVWGGAGVRFSRRQAARGVVVTPVVSSYTTLRHEFKAKLRSVTAAHGLRVRFCCALDLLAVRTLIEPFERQSYRDSHLVLVNYESVRRLVVALAGPDVRVRKMPYAAETTFLDVAGPPAELPDLAALEPRDAPLIVAVSRQDPRKGLDVLLRALARLRARGVRFRACLVGGGTLLTPHRQLARRLGLASVTLLPGEVKNAYAYLRHADVFVLPSLQEASGSVSLLEALQAGVPVVASNVDGIPEDVEDGRSALLTAPGDEEALARALTRALQDSGLRGALAARGRAVFETRFSAAALTSALAELYGELLERSRRGEGGRTTSASRSSGFRSDGTLVSA